MNFKIDKSKWTKVRLGDVATEYSKRVNNPSKSGFDRFVGNSNIGQWDFRVKSWENTSSVTSAMKLFEPNDYLLVRRSLYASDFRERAPRAHFSGVCSGDILTIRENPDVIADGFLIGVLNSPALWKFVVANASGSITRRIKWKDLANYEFLLPPKEQQAEIAELLWAMDDVVEKESKLLEGAEEALSAKRRALNEGDLKRYSGAQLTSLITKGASPKWQGFDYCDEGSLFITSENVLEDEVCLEKKKFLPLGFHEKQKRSQLQVDDILINIVGASIGRVALFREKFPHANINQAVCLFRTNKQLASPEYLVNYLLEDSNKNRLLNNQSATARPNLSLKNLSDFHFDLPELTEQQNRMNSISKVKENKRLIAVKLETSKSLQKSLINQVF